MKCKIENNKTSYPLISVSNSILVNFMNLATDNDAPGTQLKHNAAHTYVFILSNSRRKTELSSFNIE